MGDSKVSSSRGKKGFELKKVAKVVEMLVQDDLHKAKYLETVSSI